jgi:hypothetical protein
VIEILKTLRRHNEHIYRIVDVPNGIANPNGFLVPVTRSWFDDQQVDIAVLRHLTRDITAFQEITPVKSGSRQLDG